MTVRNLTLWHRWSSTRYSEHSPFSCAVLVQWGALGLSANVGVNTLDGKPASMATFWGSDDGTHTAPLGQADEDPLVSWDLFLGKHYGLGPLEASLISARMIAVVQPPLTLVQDHYTYLIEQESLTVDPYWFEQQDMALSRYMRKLPHATDFKKDIELPVLDGLAR